MYINSYKKLAQALYDGSKQEARKKIFILNFSRLSDEHRISVLAEREKKKLMGG